MDHFPDLGLEQILVLNRDRQERLARVPFGEQERTARGGDAEPMKRLRVEGVEPEVLFEPLSDPAHGLVAGGPGRAREKQVESLNEPAGVGHVGNDHRVRRREIEDA